MKSFPDARRQRPAGEVRTGLHAEQGREVLSLTGILISTADAESLFAGARTPICASRSEPFRQQMI